MEKLALSVAEVQTALGISRSAVYELVNRSDFPKIYVGRRIIIPCEALTRWLNEQTEKQAG